MGGRYCESLKCYTHISDTQKVTALVMTYDYCMCNDFFLHLALTQCVSNQMFAAGLHRTVQNCESSVGPFPFTLFINANAQVHCMINIISSSSYKSRSTHQTTTGIDSLNRDNESLSHTQELLQRHDKYITMPGLMGSSKWANNDKDDLSARKPAPP
jgi:hypothetical protein